MATTDAAASGMMQAKPSEADDAAMLKLLQGLESIFAFGVHPETDKHLSGPETWVHWLGDFYDADGRRLERVYWAGRTAIENACVADAPVLKFKPLFAAAPALLAACKAYYYGRKEPRECEAMMAAAIALAESPSASPGT